MVFFAHLKQDAESMGNVRMGPPERLVLSLRDALGARNFVETGTFRGATAEWASQNFAQVHSIERAESLYLKARERLGGIENLMLHLGDTREILPGLIDALDTPALLWLDAHWSGGETSGVDDECPLIDELEIADRAKPEVAILVDDARYFLAAPPAPHRLDDWPDLAEVVDVLSKGRERYVCITEDVIVAVPMQYRDAVVEHCRQLATESLSTKSAFRRRLRSAGRGLKRFAGR
jgi:hypothetical protein